jgi:hypothetical protein
MAGLAPFTAPALAQLVANPTFDTDESGWSASFGTALLDWSALDASGNAASGSALVTNFADTAGDGSGASQCVGGIGPQATYWVAALARFPGAQTETGHASLLTQFFSGTNCTSQLDFATSSQLSSTTQETWSPVSMLFTTPALTQSLRLRVTVYKVEPTGTLAAHFDDVELFPAVFVDGFEIGDSSAWSATEPPPP